MHAAVFLARCGLELGKALEAERLGEAHDGRGGGVRAPGQLLGGLEGRLVEVIDDVLGDVLLRARALLKARADVLGQALVLTGSVRWRTLGGGSGYTLHRRSVRRVGLAL